MGGDFFSGGVIIAVAAFLWLIYLVPTWTRRRKFMATERNAVRLQQTLRVLVETHDVPEEVRLETAAREAVAKNKALKTEEAIRRANVRASLWAAKRRAGAELMRLGASRVFRFSNSSIDARRIKRLRASCSFLGVGSLIATVVGGGVTAATGNPLVLIAGIAGLAAGLTGIVSLARMTATETPIAHAAPSRREQPTQQRVTPAANHDVHLPENRAWTPTPLPKPLNRAGDLAPVQTFASAPAPVAASLETEHRAPVAPISTARTIAASASQPSEAANAFATMGVINDADLGTTDLDAIFQRRAAS